MQTVNKEYFFETEVKNSKFLTFIMPVQAYTKRLEELKRDHPKARHYVLAYRRLNEFNQIEEYGSDDGEPKGCAGKPTLNVLRGNDLINCATITVRYFGGIKLGTGGMVRAYGMAVKNVIEHADLLSYVIKKSITIRCSYSHANQVEYFLKEQGIEVGSKAYLGESIEMKLRVTEAQVQSLLQYADEHMLISIL